jgi:hypothetical protein
MRNGRALTVKIHRVMKPEERERKRPTVPHKLMHLRRQETD